MQLLHSFQSRSIIFSHIRIFIVLLYKEENEKKISRTMPLIEGIDEGDEPKIKQREREREKKRIAIQQFMKIFPC